MKQKRIITEDFFIGNLGTPEATEEIIKRCPEELHYDEATVAYHAVPEHIHRKCLTAWLNVEESNFIETGLKKIVNNVNDMIWKFDLKNEWDTNIQFTKYSGGGDHYGWHIDNFQGDCSDRRLSIVYCLSKKSDYTGGNFQIRKSDKSVYTSKFDYGDFIVFPSNKKHRVLPLKTGNRLTMVGWFR